MSLKFITRTYKLTGKTRLLGSQPSNPDVWTTFIAAQAEKTKADDQVKHLPTEEELQNKNCTVFLRDDDGNLAIADYVIKGFLKESLGVIKGQTGLKQHASKVDNLVFVSPAYLTIYNEDGDPADCCDFFCERPLRAMTMQGPRVSVTSSECMNPGWSITFTLKILANEATKTSCALGWEQIEMALEYGSMVKGLGQWRNAQNGLFDWEVVE